MHSEKLAQDIRELILEGHTPKTAIARAIAKSRKTPLESNPETTDEPTETTLAGAIASEPAKEESMIAPEQERIVQASSISDAAKQAILKRKSSRSFRA